MLKLDIQLFADGKIVIETEVDNSGVKKGLKETENTVNKSGSTVKGIIAGLGITKLISTAMNTINASIDGAVKRVDTLNNFPKVMSNLGIGAEEAQKSITKMSDKLAGLPTTLDQGAAAVQRFTSANGDVQKSTEIFLGLNNAILAGGASSEIQASALEQLSQAYAKGKPDMMEWRTAMTAMPAQLKQVAEAMGYISADELGEALRNGTVSMDEFMDAITKLNVEGVNGFQSFEQQARNSTGGIGTSITVAKTQVVKGVADIIEGINKGLQDANLPSIGEIISNVGKKAKEVLDKFAEKIPDMIKFAKTLSEILPYIAPLVAGLTAMGVAFKTMTIIKKISDSIAAFKTGIALLQITAMNCGTTMSGLTAALKLLNLTFLANPIVLIIGAIVALVAAFVVLWNKSEAFRNFWIGLWDAIKKAFEPVITSLVNMFKEAWELIKVVWDLVEPYFTQIFNNIKIVVGILKEVLSIAFKTAWENIKAVWSVVSAFFKAVFDTIAGIFSAVKSVLSGDFKGAWEAIKSVFSNWKSFFKNLFDNVINIFVNIGSAFFNIGKNIVAGIWNGISSNLSWIKNKITGWVGNVIDFFKKILKIHSPSRVFADQIGSFMAQGIGMGFDNELDDVYRDMQRAIDLETDRMSANVQTSGTYQMAMAGTPQFNLVDNASNTTQLVVNGKVLAEVVNTENRNREVARA